MKHTKLYIALIATVAISSLLTARIREEDRPGYKPKTAIPDVKKSLGYNIETLSASQLSGYLKQKTSDISKDTAEKDILEVAGVIKKRGIGYELSIGQTVHDTFLFVKAAAEIEPRLDEKSLPGYKAAMKSLLETVYNNESKPPKNEGENVIYDKEAYLDNAISLAGITYAGNAANDLSKLKELYKQYKVEEKIVEVKSKSLFKTKTESMHYSEVNASKLSSLLDEKTKGLNKNDFVADVMLIATMIKERGIGHKTGRATTKDTFKFVVKADKILRQDILSKSLTEKFSSDEKSGKEFVALQTLLKNAQNNKLMPPTGKNVTDADLGGLSFTKAIESYNALTWGTLGGSKAKAVKTIRSLYSDYDVQ